MNRSIIDVHGGRCECTRGALYQFALPGKEKELMNSLRAVHEREALKK
jgi:hypothetical protein